MPYAANRNAEIYYESHGGADTLPPSLRGAAGDEATQINAFAGRSISWVASPCVAQ